MTIMPPGLEGEASAASPPSGFWSLRANSFRSTRRSLMSTLSSVRPCSSSSIRSSSSMIVLHVQMERGLISLPPSRWTSLATLPALLPTTARVRIYDVGYHIRIAGPTDAPVGSLCIILVKGHDLFEFPRRGPVDDDHCALVGLQLDCELFVLGQQR